MKTGAIKRFLTVLFLAFGVIIYAQDTLKASIGPHGGKAKRAGNYYIELLDSPGNIYAFPLNHDLKPITNKNITGQMTLYFQNDVSVDYPLKPHGADGFFAEVPNGFYSCKVTLYISNKKTTAVFNNETEIVEKK